MMHIDYSHAEGAHYYSIFYLAAILLGMAATGYAAYKRQYPFREFAVIVAAGILFLIIGSKLAVFDRSQWLSLFRDGHLALDSGTSVVGVILGGILGVWAVTLILGRRDSILDLAAVAFPLALAVQRVGCLFAGCCHGAVTKLPWGVTYGTESKPFMEHQHLGWIPADATTSLAVHPQQIYTILACISIALITWKTGRKWKSPSAKFIFSVLLYLAFRFAEEFTRSGAQTAESMGITSIQWKILAIIVIMVPILIFRERQFTRMTAPLDQAMASPACRWKVFSVSIVLLAITFCIGGWLSGNEQRIIILTVWPLCGMAMTEMFLRTLFSKPYVRPASLVMLALIAMSQKADTSRDKPDSYTAFHLATGAGRFNLDHRFNYESHEEIVYEEDCDGNSISYPRTYWTNDKVNYRNTYKIGGLGVSRKIYYDRWNSLLLSLNIYKGSHKQTPEQSSNPAFTPPTFNSNLFSINPMIQFDGRAIGIGTGVSVGKALGYDMPRDAETFRDYTPADNQRKTSLQFRARLFNEQKGFVELLGGYDLGSVGDHNWQLLYGSRFNSPHSLMKIGLGWSRYEGKSIVLHGQARVGPNLYLTPQVMVNYNPVGVSRKKGHRVALGLEYRLHDK